MANPGGIQEPDAKLWYRAQALRRIATDLANSLKDVADDAHVHLIPRRQGDVEDPRGGVRGVVPGKAIY